MENKGRGGEVTGRKVNEEEQERMDGEYKKRESKEKGENERRINEQQEEGMDREYRKGSKSKTEVLVTITSTWSQDRRGGTCLDPVTGGGWSGTGRVDEVAETGSTTDVASRWKRKVRVMSVREESVAEACLLDEIL